MHTESNQKIVLDNVSVAFDSLKVLEDVSFVVQENEFVSVLGPTGCGKTTLAKVIANIIQLSRGSITIEGKPHNEYDKVMSFVFQIDSCLPWLSVLDNIMLGMKLEDKNKNRNRPDIKDRALEMIELVNLDGFEDYLPIQISGGMKQRVAIARAFCMESDILIMDEPFGQIDVQTRYYMEEELLKIWDKFRRTVLFITNHDEEAVTLSDRVVKLTPLPAQISVVQKIEMERPRDMLDEAFMEYRAILGGQEQP